MAAAMKDKPSKERAFGELTHAALKQGPDVATAWLGRLPADTRPEVFAIFVVQWYDIDGAATFQWVTFLPMGPDKDKAIESPVRRVRTSDRDQAARLAAQIADESRRTRVQNDLAH